MTTKLTPPRTRTFHSQRWLKNCWSKHLLYLFQFEMKNQTYYIFCLTFSYEQISWFEISWLKFTLQYILKMEIETFVPKRYLLYRQCFTSNNETKRLNIRYSCYLSISVCLHFQVVLVFDSSHWFKTPRF